MTPLAHIMSYLVLFLSATSFIGCKPTPNSTDHLADGTNDNPTGRYYYWLDGRREAETFEYGDIPFATLSFGPPNRWRLFVFMMEDVVFAGTWTLEANTLTLVNDEDNSKATFKVGENKLTPLSGSLSHFLVMREGESLWKMSPKWEASAEGVRARDGAIDVARRIALGAIIYAGDNSETLPTTQAEFEKAVEPFVADRRMFVGFKYTFKGGKLPAESKRGSVELGIYHAPAGKVIAYLNGERKWIPRT